MTAHIRLVSSEPVGAGADIQIRDENNAARDEAPIGLPEEEGAYRNDLLGETPPPLVAEREDGPYATQAGDKRPKSSLRTLIARAWGRKPKAIAPEEKSDDAGLRDEEASRKEAGSRKDETAGDGVSSEAASLDTSAGSGETAIVTAETEPGVDESQPGPAPVKARRPFYKQKSAIAAVIAGGLGVPAIVVLNWPHRAPPPVVEPGMLADGQTKLMAPAAALATVPPREAPNVPRERPQVADTPGHELNEVLSFKGGDNTTSAGPTPESPTPGAPALDTASASPPPAAAQPAKPADSPSPKAAAAMAPAPQMAALPPSGPTPGAPALDTASASPPPAAAQPAKPTDSPSPRAAAAMAPAPQMAALPPSRPSAEDLNPAPPAPEAKPPQKVAQAQPPLSAPAAAGAAPERAAPVPSPQEPGMGEVAKLEGRLSTLETMVKDGSSETRARVEAEKAETHTLEKIAELGALVTRLTGQVKDLQDRVQTLSTGTDEKFADLTRRIALGEANRSVASAENANASHPATAEDNGSESASAGADRAHIKVVAEVKRNYRIQAASPGLAMLSVIDGSPDDRPIEVAIGTDLPGYGKVRSIEQHGEAWVVKADRGSIQ